MNDMLADYFYLSDVDGLSDIAGLLVESQVDMDFVYMLSADGRLLAASTREQIRQDYPTEGASPFGLNAARSGRSSSRFQGDQLEVASTISAGDEILGVLHFGFNSNALSQEIRSIILQHIWQGLVLIGIGIVLSYVIALYSTRPLRALAAAAGEIGRGNL